MYTLYADDVVLYQSDIGDSEYFLGKPDVKLDAGKVGSVNFTIYPSHPEYDNIKAMITRIKVTKDNGKVVFVGRVLDITKGMWKEKQCVCEDALGFLNDGYIPKMEKCNMTPHAFFRKCIQAHNDTTSSDKHLTVGTLSLDEGDVEKEFEIQGYARVKNTIDSNLVDMYGGYLSLRYNNDGSVIYVDYRQKFTETGSQTIEFAKNLIDLEDKLEGADIFTALIATGKDHITISDAASSGTENIGRDITIQTIAGDPIIRIPSAISKYGYIYRIEQFSSKETAAEVLAEAKKYILNNYRHMPNTISIKAVDMHLIDGSIDDIWVGKKYRIRSNPHGVDTYLLCQGMTIDIQNPENTTYEFGDPTQQTSEGGASQGSTSASSGKAGGGGGSLSGQTGGIGSACLWDGEDIDISKHEIILRAEENMLLESKTMELKAKDLLIDASNAQVWTNSFLVLGGELTQKEDGLQYASDDDTTPICDAKGNPIYIAPNGKPIQYGENGLPVLTEDGKYLDSDGNPVDPADCTVNSSYTHFKLIQQSQRLSRHMVAPDGHSIKMSSDGSYVTQDGKYVDTEGHLWSPEECTNKPISIAGLDTSVVVLGGALTDYQVETAEALADHGRSLTAINSDVTLIRSDLTADELTIAEQGVSITKLGSDVITLRSDLTADEATLAAHGTSITKIGSDVITLRSDLTADEATLASHGTSITKLGSDVTVIGGNLSADEATLVAHGNSLTSINTKITNINSEITNINSDIVNIKGQLVANEIAAKLATLDSVSVKSFKSSGSIVAGSAGYVMAPAIYIGSAGAANNLSGAIKSISVGIKSGDTYEIKYKDFSGTESSAGTFSRATTLTCGWSGGIFTVKASPQSKQVTTNISQGTTSWDGSTYLSCPIMAVDSDNSGYSYNTGRTVSLPVSVAFEQATVTLQGDSCSCYIEASSGGTNYYQAGSEVTYYKGGSTGTYYAAGTAITVYNAGTTTKYARGDSVSVTPVGTSVSVTPVGTSVSVTPIDSGSKKHLLSTTRYKAGTTTKVARGDSVRINGTTYYKGNGGTFTVQGISQTVYVEASSGGYNYYKAGTAKTYYNAGTAKTYYNKGTAATYYKGNGGSFTVQGTSKSVTPIGKEMSITSRGDSVKVTPINSGTKKHLLATTRFKAGTTDKTTYFKKKAKTT